MPMDVMYGYVELKGTIDPGLTGLRLYGSELPKPATYVAETNRLLVLMRIFLEKQIHRGFSARVRATGKILFFLLAVYLFLYSFMLFTYYLTIFIHFCIYGLLY